MPGPRPFLPPGSATIDDFLRLDLRIGRIVAARTFPEARKPAYQLDIDFGPGGIRRSSAQLPGTYPDPAGPGRPPRGLRGELPAATHRGLHERGAGARRPARGRPHPAAGGRRGRRSRATRSAEHDVRRSATSGAAHDTPREYAGWRLRAAGWSANVCRPGRPADAPETCRSPPAGRRRCGLGLRDHGSQAAPVERVRRPARRLRGRTRPGAMTAIDGCQAGLARCPW